MSKAEEMLAVTEHATQPGTAPIIAETKRDSSAHLTRLERMAERVGIALGDALLAGTEARSELDELVAEILSLQGQVTEWGKLHHLVHEVLLALAPFLAALGPLAAGDLSATERQALLQNWRLCQEKMDFLVDFAEDIRHIGHPFHRIEQGLLGERWAVEPVALRLLVEDTLKEDNTSPRALYDLGDDFRTACHRHLALANRQLLRAIGQLERLSKSLLGGTP